MKSFCTIFFLLVPTLIAGCTSGQVEGEAKEEAWKEFKNEAYGFSFLYPSGWNEISKDLPEKWATLDKDDLILFTVNKAQYGDLLELGKAQALRDIYPRNGANNVANSQEKIDSTSNIVKLETFNGTEWYTYAIKFSDKEVDSVVSGTLCGDNEINLVMVSSFGTFEKNELIYGRILDSFEC